MDSTQCRIFYGFGGDCIIQTPGIIWNGGGLYTDLNPKSKDYYMDSVKYLPPNNTLLALQCISPAWEHSGL